MRAVPIRLCVQRFLTPELSDDNPSLLAVRLCLLQQRILVLQRHETVHNLCWLPRHEAGARIVRSLRVPSPVLTCRPTKLHSVRSHRSTSSCLRATGVPQIFGDAPALSRGSKGKDQACRFPHADGGEIRQRGERSAGPGRVHRGTRCQQMVHAHRAENAHFGLSLRRWGAASHIHERRGRIRAGGARRDHVPCTAELPRDWLCGTTRTALRS